ncbi:MAG: hypothetical protein AAF289_14005 [Cyanobacteria bacterium P01_A01_bin.135]
MTQMIEKPTVLSSRWFLPSRLVMIAIVELSVFVFPNYGCATYAPCRTTAKSCSSVDQISTDLEGEAYELTRFEFRYGRATRVIEDRYDKLWICGELPDSVSVVDQTRLVVYTSPGAGIKLCRESIGVGLESVSYGGYMGVSSKSTRFFVTSDGTLEHGAYEE